MSAEEVSLAKLVDAAIGSPEQGAVNFNALYSLLHGIVAKLGDSSISAEKLQKLNPKSAKSRVDQDGTESVFTADSGLPRDGTFGGNTELLDRLSTVETQLDALNSLPSGKDVFDQVFSAKGKPDNRAVSDLWQMVQVKRKAEANEEGLGRLSSLVDELMKEMARMRKENESLRSDLKELSSLKDVWDRISQLESQITDIRESVKNLPGKDAFKNMVTWESLEKALRGIREDMAKLKPPERVVVNMATDPMSRPQSPGPSEALREMLESLGQLSDKHDSLEVRVDKLEHEMPNKADKSDLENLKLPDDLLKQLDSLRSLVDNMRQSRDRDIEALNRIRKALTDQQKELERINNVLEALSQGNENVNEKLQELYQITSRLDEVKADRSLLDELLEPKADKVQLETKVNFNLFDETTGNLNSQIDELLQKLLSTEEDLRKLLQLLGSDLEGKLDRLEMDSLKDWLEKRLKALAAKIKSGQASGNVGDLSEDDAAGLRRQLLQHFHCISCDRPLELMSHPPVPSLPEKPALAATKSMRPYTTFELESIRQHARSLNSGEVLDAYYTPRAAGGSHTLTHPNRRVARAPVAVVPEEEAAGREEMEIQGMDGHMYKGRIDRVYAEVREDTRLPPVSGAKGRGQQQQQPQTSRPSTSSGSKELAARPQSSRARPQSARNSEAAGPAPTPSVEMPPAADEE